ncbi:TRAP transporter small permease [Jannaschia sp. CCS1]|uniref:TRAP transporter small permease n=1 Tax=Jannaschia sp. (strain CCS1) TaxID=290400 RepID=UPI000053B003|nr:TRAP transporter small permease [Jannaschia sp. CCS1]ABD53788.1 TRAP dicarboxylate transporter DctQ subunit [Jannaschia sp. CCS1]
MSQGHDQPPASGDADRAPSLSSIDRVLGTLSRVAAGIGALWIFGIMVLINLDVVMRGVASAPLPAVPEFVALSITGIVFLQLAAALRSGRFIKSDALGAILFERVPVLGRVLRPAMYALGATLFSVLAYASWRILMRAIERGTYVGTIGGVTFPIWPISLIIVLGACLVALEYALMALKEVLSR